MQSGFTREAAKALLEAHNKEPYHIEHAETVEGIMRYFAESYDAENVDFWGIAGLLHDVDWEEFPTAEEHTIKGGEMIRAAGGTDELVHAVQSHNADMNELCPDPEHHMEKVLYATDELSGLIGAAIKMRPSGSVMDFSVSSLKKKFKDKRFAAGCSRDIIKEGADMLGWELDELFERTIAAMQSFAPDKDA
jgi:putative nucleotidyltransferase with HDIG domain